MSSTGSAATTGSDLVHVSAVGRAMEGATDSPPGVMLPSGVAGSAEEEEADDDWEHV